MARTTSTAAENTAASRLLDGGAKRILGMPRHRRQGLDFGLRHFPRIHTGYASAVHMDLHHDAIRLSRALLKHRLQHVHHEFHGRVIVVEEHDLVERRLLFPDFRPLLDLLAGLVPTIGHGNSLTSLTVRLPCGSLTRTVLLPSQTVLLPSQTVLLPSQTVLLSSQTVLLSGDVLNFL